MMTQKKFMVIGAHPDDCELMAGGTAVKLVAKGCRVKFVSCTDGSAGHHSMQRGELAGRRYREAQNSATVGGLDGYEILDNPDGTLVPSLQSREKLIRLIRSYKPDVVITHRLCDYHADHRATAQLVQDASYLLMVPLACPDTPALTDMPVIMFSWDNFRKPMPFAADVAVAIDDTADEKLQMCNCHESQFYEWLPFTIHELEKVPAGKAERLEYIRKAWFCRDEMQAQQARALLKNAYGDKAAAIKYAETFELSEYGRQLTASELAQLFMLP